MFLIMFCGQSVKVLQRSARQDESLFSIMGIGNKHEARLLIDRRPELVDDPTREPC